MVVAKGICRYTNVMSHAKFKKSKKPPKKYKAFSRQNRQRVPLKQRMMLMFAPWLPYILIVLVLAFAWKTWVLLQSPVRFPLAHVEVIAPYNHVTQARLKQAMSDAIHGGFFSLDIQQFQSLVKTDLPWVQSLSVRRIWPDGIRVTVNEKQAIASWNGTSLLTPKGALFVPPKASFPDNIVALSGPNEALSQVLQEYLQLRDALAPEGGKVVSLTMTDRGAWHVMLSNGVELLLGRNNIQQRIARLVAVYQQVVSGKESKIRAIDLRYPNGFAVSWKAST